VVTSLGVQVPWSASSTFSLNLSAEVGSQLNIIHITRPCTLFIGQIGSDDHLGKFSHGRFVIGSPFSHAII
jgi:hypothetical protein